MRITTFAPGAALASFVARYTVVETDGAEETHALLPSLGLIAGVRFAGGAHLRGTRMPEVSLAGVQTSVRRMTTLPYSGAILAEFVAGGAAACFDLPLHELAGSTLALDDEVLRERVGAAADHAARAAIFEAALTARLHERRDALVEAALAAIIASRGDIRIADLAKRLATTQDPLEKRFRRSVGASPKQVASLVRVRHAMALGQRGATWSQAAHAAGYFDQAHFNREFRAVTGEAPTAFFRDTAYC